MQFRLIFEGQVMPRQRANLRDIHGIRQQLHAQIARLWEYPPLSESKKWLGFRKRDDDYRLFEQVDQMVFAPVISKRIDLLAEIDIVFLRNQPPGQLISEGGDIDNRIKTLLDALRVPSKAEVQKLGESTKGDPSPMYCLLQDDSLITRLNIETDRLLRTAASKNDLISIIHVKTQASRVTMGNMALMS